MKITSTSRTSLPAVPPSPKKEPAATAVKAGGWGRSSSPSEKKVLEGVIDEAIGLKSGASFNVRLGHARQVASTFGQDSTRVITERLASKLPAGSPEERARIYRAATTLGANSAALTERILRDAVNSGDAKLALELVHDGAKLSKSDRTKLAPHIRGDDVLQSADGTKDLTRTAISVLAEQPAQLEKFARSVSSPAVLFVDVLVNKDKALAAVLKPLVKLLTPKEADGLARRHFVVTDLRADFQARAAQK